MKTIAGTMRWGTWGADLDETGFAKLISGCLELGIDTFDNADIYGGHTTETGFGGGWRAARVDRSDIKIITKCGIKMHSSVFPYNVKQYDTTLEYIESSVNRSLRELQTDYIDQVLIHRPSPLMDMEDLANTFKELEGSGKVRSFGVSNFTPYQIDILAELYPLAANQIEISCTNHTAFTDDSLILAAANGLEIQAWSPLGGGVLWNAESEENKARNVRFQEVADRYGWSLDEMAYYFLFHHHIGIRPVTGTSKIERIQTAVACEKSQITDQQWFEIYEASCGHEVG